jgi:hypothetical protein
MVSGGTGGLLAAVSLCLIMCGCGGSPTPTPQPVDVAALMLTATEASAAISAVLPIAQSSDSEILGQSGTDERRFLGSDGSLIANIALYPHDSPAAAASGYPSLVSATCGTDRSLRTPPKIGAANQSAELECLANAIFVVAFQQGAVDSAVASRVAKVSEELAIAEAAKLKRSSGA